MYTSVSQTTPSSDQRQKPLALSSLLCGTHTW
jgi:hypothetical protein